jgi:DNA-directed RNA polymerase subunit omega
MARVTIENVKKRIANRYEIILLAAHRARNLEFGAKPLIDTKNKKIKNALLALMEIESGKIDLEELKKAVMNQGDNSLKVTEIVEAPGEKTGKLSSDASATGLESDDKAEKDIYEDEEITE